MTVAEAEDDYREFISLREDATLRSVRVDLLFGPSSRVPTKTALVVRDLGLLERLLQEDAPTRRDSDGQIFRSATEYQQEFTEEVWRMIDARWWRAVWARLG